MPMQWITPRNDPEWTSISADGYYRIAPDKGRGHEYFHVEALWARPVKLGQAWTLGDAQRLCEQHREREPAPTDQN